MKKDQNRLVWSKVGDESWRAGDYEINRYYRLDGAHYAAGVCAADGSWAREIMDATTNWTFDKLGAAKAACQADWHFAQ
jgi:hypothetical protein